MAKQSDGDLALLWVETHGQAFRYVPQWDYWLKWTGSLWERDWDEATVTCSMVQLHDQDVRRTRDLICLARKNPKVVAQPDQFDACPTILNTLDGVYDLVTGEQQEPDPNRYVTRQTAVGVGGECPRFLAHLRWCLKDDPDQGRFLTRYLGYCLTGMVKEQCLLLLYGSGANGKSVLLDTILKVMGSYAVVAPQGLITSRDGDVRPDAVARMQGVRFALVSESEVGHRLNEGQIKQLTGDGRVSARRLYGDHFDFEQSAKFVMATNHKPQARGCDEGLWRRLKVMCFSNYCPPEERDPELAARLFEEEGPAILAQLIAWATRYAQEGLPASEAVEATTREYRREIDTLGAFVEECYEERAGEMVPARQLYQVYQRWAEERGEKPWTEKLLTMALKERGLAHRRTCNGSVWVDLVLKGA